ncbi:MAG: LysR substrate-binding domain-containing protein, partial [Pseudomonadota bacterium]
FEVGLYAATSYLDRVGRSSDIDALMARDLVGYDRDRRVIDGMIAAGIPADRGTFATRCDAPMTQWELIAAGCGLGFGACATGEADPRVERIPVPFDIPSLPMWLTTSQALRRTPRIAAIWELLAERLGRGPGAPAWRAPPA